MQNLKQNQVKKFFAVFLNLALVFYNENLLRMLTGCKVAFNYATNQGGGNSQIFNATASSSS